MQLGTTSEGGESNGWNIGHLQHVVTSTGTHRQQHIRRQSLLSPLVVVRRYKLHSRCSGQHVLVSGRRPTARAPPYSDRGNLNDFIIIIIIIIII